MNKLTRRFGDRTRRVGAAMNPNAKFDRGFCDKQAKKIEMFLGKRVSLKCVISSENVHTYSVSADANGDGIVGRTKYSVSMTKGDKAGYANMEVYRKGRSEGMYENTSDVAKVLDKLMTEDYSAYEPLFRDNRRAAAKVSAAAKTFRYRDRLITASSKEEAVRSVMRSIKASAGKLAEVMSNVDGDNYRGFGREIQDAVKAQLSGTCKSVTSAWPQRNDNYIDYDMDVVRKCDRNGSYVVLRITKDLDNGKSWAYAVARDRNDVEVASKDCDDVEDLSGLMERLGPLGRVGNNATSCARSAVAKAPAVRYMSEKRGEQMGISECPNFDKSGSVRGMRKMYYGDNALLVRCGNYIYNVTSKPEIYDAASANAASERYSFGARRARAGFNDMLSEDALVTRALDRLADELKGYARYSVPNGYVLSVVKEGQLYRVVWADNGSERVALFNVSVCREKADGDEKLTFSVGEVSPRAGGEMAGHTVIERSLWMSEFLGMKDPEFLTRATDTDKVEATVKKAFRGVGVTAAARRVAGARRARTRKA